MRRAAATPLPETSATAIPIRPLARVQEIIVVAADGPGGDVSADNCAAAWRTGGCFGQQAPLDFGREREVPAQLLLFD